MSAKGLDGSKKWPVLMTFSTDFKLTKCAVGGSESVQDYADVICGWSLSQFVLHFDTLQKPIGSNWRQEKTRRVLSS